MLRQIVDIKCPHDVAGCGAELKQWMNKRKIDHKTFFDMISGAGNTSYIINLVLHLYLSFFFYFKHLTNQSYLVCKAASLNKVITPDIPSTSQKLKLSSVAYARNVHFNPTVLMDSGSATNDDKLRRGDHGHDEQLLSKDVNLDLPGPPTDFRSESVVISANSVGIRAQTDCRTESIDRTANSANTQAQTDCRTESIDRTANCAGTSGDSSVVSIYLIYHFEPVATLRSR